MWTTGPASLMGQKPRCPPQTGGEKPHSQVPVPIGTSGETLAVLPEGEEMFSVNLGALLVIRLDWLRLPLLCRSQHSKTADLFIKTKPSKDKKTAN